MAKLLFVNTFSHDSIEDFNIDFVKFSAGALATIREVRIIPGGARIPVAEAPQRQGLTSPNSFNLEVFAKSFKQTDSTRFERIALFEYHFDSDIRFQVPAYTTDGILFKGKYTALTVAIYGDPVSGDTADLSSKPAPAASAVSTVPVLVDPSSAGAGLASTAAPAIVQQTAGASSSSFVPAPTDVGAGGFIAAPILTVGTPIPTWVSPPVPPVIHHMAPPPSHATYNPLVPPPISVIPPYSPAPGTSAPAAGVFGPGPSHVAPTAGVVPMIFDPTRPPPTFLTPQHSPQLVPPSQPPSQQQQQASPSDQQQRQPQPAGHSRRQQQEPATTGAKGKRRNSISESSKDQSHDGKPIDGLGPAGSRHNALGEPMEERQLEDGEYANSDGGTSEKENFDLENISDEEFEFDDTMAADMNECDLQEDLLSSVRFDPYHFVMEPLKYFTDPALSQFEVDLRAQNVDAFRDDGEKLTAALESCCDTETLNEKWVCALEEICGLVATGLVYIIRGKYHKDSSIDRLISCTLDGLDVDKACQQQQALFTLRHLKAGIRLATALFQTEEAVAAKLFDANVQHRLLDLLESEVTSTPVMLQIVNALDASIFVNAGLDSCVVLSSSAHHSGDARYRVTPFQRLVRFIRKKRPSRVMVAIHRFMQKVVLHQSLKTLFSTAKKMAERARARDVAPPANGDDQNSLSSASDGEAILEDADVDELCDSIGRIISFYCNARDVLCQPPRCLPTSAVFALPPIGHGDPYPAIYRMFNRQYMLPCLYLLLSNWTTGNDPRVVTAIHRLLSSLLANDSGLRYLATSGDVVQEMLQLFLQKTDECTEDEIQSSLMQEFGLDLCYHLQCLHYVDVLLDFHHHHHHSGAEAVEVDNVDVLKTLQAFYVLTLGGYSTDRQGVRAAVHVLSQANYLDSILPFIQLTGDAELDNKIKKSACAGYASELLLLVLRHAESVDYLKTFQERILAISSQEVTSKIAEVKQWVEPLRKLPGYTVEALDYLADRIKTFVQKDGIVPRIPKGLITTLRLARHIAVEPPRHDEIDKPRELYYSYALVQLHYHGTLSVLLELIDKLADSQLLNWQQGISLNNKHGQSFFACVVPAISLVRSILTYLVHCRGSEFQDLTPVASLMRLFTVCCTLMPSLGVSREGHVVRREIVQALLAFTQPGVVDEQEITGVENSLWTKMMVEILNFTAEVPYRYVAGLHILSELLPLPLPVQSKQALTPEDSAIIQRHRRLWSAHLTPIADKIQSVVRDFACSTQQLLQQGLRRVCLQLSDLSASMADIVVRAVADVVLENCETTETKKPRQEPESADVTRTLVLPATAGFAQSLNLQSYMVSQASFKISLLSLLQAKKDKPSTDDYGRLLQYLLTILNHQSEERSHRMSQELIVSTLQSLCDEEVCMVSCAQGDRSTLEQLACCMPGETQLQEICRALVIHVGDSSQTYATILPALRILVMLCEHDYGLECIKSALQDERGTLLSFFERILDEFSGHSSDCISTLSTLLLLLRMLQVVDGDAPLRTKRLGGSLARKILGWDVASTSDDHCLAKLEKLLAGATEEDSSLDSLREDVTNLITTLSNGTGADEDTDEPEERFELPPALDVERQFSSRPIWVICQDPSEDRLQPHYWFPPDILDEDEEMDMERVSINLETMMSQYIPGFDLSKELAEKISAKRAEDAEAIKRKAMPGIINTSRGERKRYIAPLRGRGMAPRGGAITRSHDPFRSRIPNTSRPPSMHVDDFILAQHIQSTSGPSAIGQDGGDAGRSMNAGKMMPKAGSGRSGGPRTDGDQGAIGGRSSWYRPKSPDGRGGRTFSNATPGGNASRPYRPRENVFDRPRERHSGQQGGNTKQQPKSSSSRKSPSRHRSSSKQ